MKITRRQLRRIIRETILEGEDGTDHRSGERRADVPVVQSGPGPGDWEDVDWPGMPEWSGDPFSDIEVELDAQGNWVSRS